MLAIVLNSNRQFSINSFILSTQPERDFSLYLINYKWWFVISLKMLSKAGGSWCPMTAVLADLEGACLAHAPQGSRFFRFDIHNFRNVTASGVHAPLRGPRPLREILDPPLCRVQVQGNEQLCCLTVNLPGQTLMNLFSGYSRWHPDNN